MEWGQGKNFRKVYFLEDGAGWAARAWRRQPPPMFGARGTNMASEPPRGLVVGGFPQNPPAQENMCRLQARARRQRGALLLGCCGLEAALPLQDHRPDNSGQMSGLETTPLRIIEVRHGLGLGWKAGRGRQRSCGLSGTIRVARNLLQVGANGATEPCQSNRRFAEKKCSAQVPLKRADGGGQRGL